VNFSRRLEKLSNIRALFAISVKFSNYDTGRTRQLVIDDIDYAAYRETDSALQDSHKNRLFGSEHYKSGRPVYKPSPWVEGDFEAQIIVPSQPSLMQRNLQA